MNIHRDYSCTLSAKNSALLFVYIYYIIWQVRIISRTSRLAFEVRKLSRRGSKETVETDLLVGRVLLSTMNLRVYSRLSTLYETYHVHFCSAIYGGSMLAEAS